MISRAAPESNAELCQPTGERPRLGVTLKSLEAEDLTYLHGKLRSMLCPWGSWGGLGEGSTQLPDLTESACSCLWTRLSLGDSQSFSGSHEFGKRLSSESFSFVLPLEAQVRYHMALVGVRAFG